jgi:hypothetical protein
MNRKIKINYDKTIREQRDREIRDVYKQLAKKYRYNVVIEVITQHYFILEPGIQHIMARVDDEPVGHRPSAAYKTLMNSNFRL